MLHSHLLCGCARDGSFFCEAHRSKDAGTIPSLLALGLFLSMVYVWSALLSGA